MARWRGTQYVRKRLRVKHQLTIRILPVDVMPDLLRRTDLHARQLQLSETLDPASRTFAAAYQLAQIEARDAIEALVRGAGFSDRAAERLCGSDNKPSLKGESIDHTLARLLRAGLVLARRGGGALVSAGLPLAARMGAD